jgi:formate dehydrogenase subunit delta
METSRLVKMANDIGAFFEAGKHPEKGAAGVAEHIRKFWDPRMRRELLLHFDERSGDGLTPIVLEALKSHGHALASSPK